MEFIQEELAFRHYDSDGKMDAEITYQEDGDVLIADHTYVDPALRGQKIGKQLVDKLADFARQNRKKIHPTCPYVVELFNKSSEYTDIEI